MQNRTRFLDALSAWVEAHQACLDEHSIRVVEFSVSDDPGIDGDADDEAYIKELLKAHRDGKSKKIVRIQLRSDLRQANIEFDEHGDCSGLMIDGETSKNTKVKATKFEDPEDVARYFDAILDRLKAGNG